MANTKHQIQGEGLSDDRRFAHLISVPTKGDEAPSSMPAERSEETRSGALGRAQRLGPARSTRAASKELYRASALAWKYPAGLPSYGASTNVCSMKRGIARLWKEAGRWVIQIDLDGVPYCERDYADVATATQAMATILRQRAERSEDLDQDAGEDCDEPLDLLVCSQCGADGCVRTCEHGGPPPIRMTEAQ